MSDQAHESLYKVYLCTPKVNGLQQFKTYCAKRCNKKRPTLPLTPTLHRSTPQRDMQAWLIKENKQAVVGLDRSKRLTAAGN